MNEERGGTNLCFFQVKKKNRRRRPERERESIKIFPRAKYFTIC